ncbi:hypothetical protein BGZ76_007247 [Entomortierella beljakovae]|nr:hypothetical protein BGZ76_007247 [Entomortierella beljakovae]
MRLLQIKKASSWPIAVAASLASLAFLPLMVRGDIQCVQYGSDTFRVGSTIKFQWTDTGSTPIDTFDLNFYCYENGILIKRLVTLNTTSTATSRLWVVDQSIMDTLSECSLNQYQGRYDWTYQDPVTGTPTNGSAPCKSILLVGPGVAPPLGVTPSDPQLTDDPNPGTVEITDRTKVMVIGVGCTAGFLVMAGFVGFYIIRYQNRRAEESAGKILQEPSLSPSEDGGHDAGSGIHYNGQYETVSKSEVVEMGNIPSPASQGFLSGSQAYVTNHHSGFPATSANKPPSLIASPFTPQEEKLQRAQEQEQQQ